MSLPLYCDQYRRHVRWVLRQLPSLAATAPQLQRQRYVILSTHLAPTASKIQPTC